MDIKGKIIQLFTGKKKKRKGEFFEDAYGHILPEDFINKWEYPRKCTSCNTESIQYTTKYIRNFTTSTDFHSVIRLTCSNCGILTYYGAQVVIDKILENNPEGI